MYFENLIALHIAIEKHCTPEMAFKYLDKVLEGEIQPKIRHEWGNKEVEDIKKFRLQGLSFSKIGEIYCTTASNIFKVLNYKKRAAGTAQFKNFL